MARTCVGHRGASSDVRTPRAASRAGRPRRRARSRPARSRTRASCADVWSVTRSKRSPAVGPGGLDLGGVADQRDRDGLAAPRRPREPSRAPRQDRGSDDRRSRCRGVAGRGPGSTSIARQTPSFIVTARGCAPPIPPRPAVSVTVPRERAAEVLPRRLGERLVRALQDPLGPDVDPGAGGHLAVHHQTRPLELAEVVPGRPARRPGSSSRSAPAAPIRGSAARRPACHSGPAASRRRRAFAARGRSHRRRPSSRAALPVPP